MTFSITGIGCSELKGETIPEFYIPNNTNVYRGEVRVKTHTVFVFKGYVFTYEVASWSMALCRYREALDQINNRKVLAVNEKVKKGR
jgi:hypothetical protein